MKRPNLIQRIILRLLGIDQQLYMVIKMENDARAILDQLGKSDEDFYSSRETTNERKDEPTIQDERKRIAPEALDEPLLSAPEVIGPSRQPQPEDVGAYPMHLLGYAPHEHYRGILVAHYVDGERLYFVPIVETELINILEQTHEALHQRIEARQRTRETDKRRKMH